MPCADARTVINRQSIDHLLTGLLIASTFASIPFTRQFNGANLVAGLFVCMVALPFMSRVHRPPTPLILFSLICCLYATLSTLVVLPSAWTTLHQIGAIPQQSLFAPLIAILFLLLHTHIRRLEGDPRRLLRDASILLALTLAAAYFGHSPTHFHNLLTTIHGLQNVPAIQLIVLSAALLCLRSGWARIPLLAVFLWMSARSPFGQNIVFAALFVAIWLAPRHAVHLLMAYVAASLCTFIVAVLDPFVLHGVDPNITVRMFLLRDALAAFWQSGGIGIGFGTESISNYYPEHHRPVFFDPFGATFIHIGTHNSFATVLMRTGVPGFGLLLWLLVGFVRRAARTGDPGRRAFVCGMIGFFYTTMMLNPALESFVYLYGVILTMSAAWAMSDPPSPPAGSMLGQDGNRTPT